SDADHRDLGRSPHSAIDLSRAIRRIDLDPGLLFKDDSFVFGQQNGPVLLLDQDRRIPCRTIFIDVNLCSCGIFAAWRIKRVLFVTHCALPPACARSPFEAAGYPEAGEYIRCRVYSV